VWGIWGFDPRKCATPSGHLHRGHDPALVAGALRERAHRPHRRHPDQPPRELSPRIKSLNYLSHILAKVEGIAAGVDEVIMLDPQGYVAEASGMNLFRGHQRHPQRRRPPTPGFCAA